MKLTIKKTEIQDGPAPVQSTPVTAGSAIAPASASQKAAHLIFGILGILSVLCFLALIGLQFSEVSYYSADPSLWPVK